LYSSEGGDIQQAACNLGMWKSGKNSLELEKPGEMAGCWGCPIPRLQTRILKSQPNELIRKNGSF